MSGSRKGEKRGAAGGKRTYKPTDALGVELPHGKHARRPSRSQEEYYRDIARVITGTTASESQPREVMLKAMRYFEAQADEYLEMARWLRRQLLGQMTPEDVQANDQQLAIVEGRVREFYLLMVDVAYKCAPYVHPRLQAIQVGSGAGKDSATILGQLLEEIDQTSRGRPSWAPPTLELTANKPGEDNGPDDGDRVD
jgi:hypothetical protein